MSEKEKPDVNNVIEAEFLRQWRKAHYPKNKTIPDVKEEKGLSLLMQGLTDPDMRVRRAALEGLDMLGQEFRYVYPILPLLVRLIDRDRSVRKAARRIVKRQVLGIW